MILNKLGLGIVFLLCISLIPNVLAYSQENSTSKNTLNVKLETEPAEPKPGEKTKLNIEFIDPKTEQTQPHVDYTVKVENNGKAIFGPIQLTHTSIGSVSIPVTLEDGKNIVGVNIEGVLFQPISKEMAEFEIIIGEAKVNEQTGTEENIQDTNKTEQKIPIWIRTNAGWWAKGEIDDKTFVSGIQYLIKEGIISVSSSSQNTENNSKEIPKWIKNNADWWSQGAISDNDFLKGIEFLVKNGIIQV